MNRFLRGRVALAAAIALAAAASDAHASRAGRPRLWSPAPRSVIRAGERAEIAVAGAPEGAEEWEAFLSLDGGETWPLRVTPHLPIAETSFRWIVPALPPGTARVKVRFGGAAGEREFVLDEAFSIAGGPGPLIVPEPTAIGASPAPGEEGTVAWVDASRGTVVPPAPRAVEPASRWQAAGASVVAFPGRHTKLPAAEEAAERPPASSPKTSAPAPVRRSIASLSRLNV
ncbi:MAG TPA: hypothetical protein VG777_00565 [Thermoanaerobaculia bacterium]|nr:hypothetical protein [Thermoanaerobaculia bacterium]